MIYETQLVIELYARGLFVETRGTEDGPKRFRTDRLCPLSVLGNHTRSMTPQESVSAIVPEPAGHGEHVETLRQAAKECPLILTATVGPGHEWGEYDPMDFGLTSEDSITVAYIDWDTARRRGLRRDTSAAKLRRNGHIEMVPVGRDDGVSFD